jgi:hypothetical protein
MLTFVVRIGVRIGGIKWRGRRQKKGGKRLLKKTKRFWKV